jgi:hypothetical protein
MKKLIIPIVVFVLGICSCSQNIHFQKKINKKKDSIAVLPFSGTGISQNEKYLAADELTTFLFLDKKIPVIDRSQINSFIKTLQIENPYVVSKEQLIHLADTLNATVLVLGLIEKKSIQNELEDSITAISITLRFLDGQSGEVRGIIYEQEKSELPRFEIIRDMLRSMVNKI